MFKLSCLLFICFFAAISCRSIQKRQSCVDFSPIYGDCSRYYRCANGVAYTESCPAGTLFDPNLRVCNWANQVTNCYGSGVAYNSGSYQGTACSYNNDYTQVPNDCSRYFRCVNGFYQVQTCAAGTLFDSNLRQCVWSNQVTTCNTGYNTGYNTDYNTGYNTGYNIYGYPTGGSCNQAQDLTQVQNDCTRYYRCASGVLSTEQCPSGLLFDANLKICNWANQVTTCNNYLG
ncbi:unnamed protein product [Brachionus calyciflorus]|uniref:Chitin-binding type-2 domain-containing protein n=1 Tax=Brachionus calyciflorus TaxID=104777 RepID=A0A813W8A2_9BILA|nr:unnamed protein product [Brachionus calyciflorus]